MKKIVMLLVALGSSSFVYADRKIVGNILISNHLQCTSDLARSYYRGLFVNVNSAQPNDWNNNLIENGDGKSQMYSSMTNICWRKSRLENVKSFVAHLILRHIADARRAMDGLGITPLEYATQVAVASTMGVGSTVEGAVAGVAIGAAISGTAGAVVGGVSGGALGGANSLIKHANDRVNFKNPNFEVSFKRLLFLRYGLIKGTKYGQQDSSNLDLAALFDRTSITTSLFGWEDVQRLLPEVAQELDKTIKDMWIKWDALKHRDASGNLNQPFQTSGELDITQIVAEVKRDQIQSQSLQKK